MGLEKISELLGKSPLSAIPFWDLVRNLIPFGDPYNLAFGVFVAMVKLKTWR